MEYTTGVYQIRNTVNGKIYVGGAYKSFSRRWDMHQFHLGRGTHFNRHLQVAWDKYGSVHFSFEILERCEPVKEKIMTCEQEWIDRLVIGNESKCYNMCPTAGSALGRKASVETCRKLSEKLKGRVTTKETREKMSRNRKGKIPSKEVLEKAHAGWRGRHHTEEAKRKIGEASSRNQTGRKLSPESIAKRTSKQKGMKRSEETKRRLSEALKKRGTSKETRDKITATKRTPEYRAKASARMLGTKASVEARKAMSEAQKRRFQREREERDADTKQQDNQAGQEKG